MWPEAVGFLEAVGRGEEMLVVRAGRRRVEGSCSPVFVYEKIPEQPLGYTDEGACGGAQSLTHGSALPGGPGWGALALTLLLRHRPLCLESAGPVGSTSDMLGAQGRHQPRAGSRPPCGLGPTHRLWVGRRLLCSPRGGPGLGSGAGRLTGPSRRLGCPLQSPGGGEGDPALLH